MTTSMRLGLRAFAAAVVVVGIAVVAAPTLARADGVGLSVRKVDTSAFPTVTLSMLRPSSASNADPVKITENGKAISNINTKTPAEAGVAVGEVLVLDTSESMSSNKTLDKVKAAANAMIDSKPDSEQLAIVATNGMARQVANFTADKALLHDSVNTLASSGDNSLWSAMDLAASLYAKSPGQSLQPNIVVVAGSGDTINSSRTYNNALSNIRTQKAVVFPVAIKQSTSFDTAQLKSMASQTGGRYIEAPNGDSATQLLAGVESAIENQAIVSYQSTGGPALSITATLGAASQSIEAAAGTVSEGVDVSAPVVKTHAGFLSGTGGLLLVSLVTLACVALLAYGIIEIVGREQNKLSSALRPYSDEPKAQNDIAKLADSEIIRKAVASTAKLAESRGVLQAVEARLAQADLPLRPAEALFFTAVIAVIAMIIGAIFGGIIGLAGAGLVFAYVPIAVTSFLARRRRNKFTSQLPDALQLLAGSLRAGYSLMQGLDAVSKQAEAPIGQELGRAMAEARLGRPVEEALQELADRMGSEDFEWAVMAIRIQREVGGNLAELLMTVSDTMVARERLRREVRALTAEGRLSAIILSILPFAVGGLIMVINPNYMQPMLSQTLGQLAIVGAVLMVGFGYYIMTKMVQIEA